MKGSDRYVLHKPTVYCLRRPLRQQEDSVALLFEDAHFGSVVLEYDKEAGAMSILSQGRNQEEAIARIGGNNYVSVSTKTNVCKLFTPTKDMIERFRRTKVTVRYESFELYARREGEVAGLIRYNETGSFIEKLEEDDRVWDEIVRSNPMLRVIRVVSFNIPPKQPKFESIPLEAFRPLETMFRQM